MFTILSPQHVETHFGRMNYYVELIGTLVYGNLNLLYEASLRMVRVAPITFSHECSSHVTTYFRTFVRTFESMLCRGSNIHVKVINPIPGPIHFSSNFPEMRKFPCTLEPHFRTTPLVGPPLPTYQPPESLLTYSNGILTPLVGPPL